MRRKEDLPLRKHTLNLYDGDFVFFQNMYERVGASRAIRRLLRNYREKIEAEAIQGDHALEHLSIEDIEILEKEPI